MRGKNKKKEKGIRLAFIEPLLDAKCFTSSNLPKQLEKYSHFTDLETSELTRDPQISELTGGRREM